MRTLSYSEVSKALDCQAAWDFRYGDYLAGDSLTRPTVAPRLSQGKAWGAGVAAYHHAMSHPSLISPQVAAELAAATMLDLEAKEQIEKGVHDPDHHADLLTHVLGLLEHYPLTEHGQREFALDTLEGDFEVGIPSRTGRRRSTKYRFLARVDGVDRALAKMRFGSDLPWLVEFKLRVQLTPVELIANSRQIRWYAWAHWQRTGEKVGGVWVEERLNEVPKPPRIVAAKRKGEGIDGKVPSQAKNQVTTAEQFVAVCEEYDVVPDPETVEHLASRKWSQRVPVQFREGELEQSGRELTSAAKQIGLLDAGELLPLRNVKRSNCNGCDYKEICPSPDERLVDSLFERRPAKRNRSEEAAWTA